jgi:MraZ protein
MERERTAFLTGEFRHALDDRGRVAIPARFRTRLGQGATLARWLDGCLAIFPGDAWDELAAKLQALPTTNAAARQFGRFMSSGAVDVELDKQGRVLVPSYLREYAGLEAGEVVVVGALNRLEIWAPSAWQPYRSKIEDEPEVLAEHLADLGI